MKKILTYILILALCFTVIGGIVACNDEVDDSGNQTDEGTVPPSTDNNDNANDDSDDDNNQEVVIPRADYTEETIDGVRYIYYGAMPQKAASQEITNVLQNLVASSQLAPNESGYYTYAGVDYAMVTVNEQKAGRRLSNGLNTEKDKNYFFTIDKLRWRVLEVKDGNAFLLCDTVVAKHCFNPTGSYNALGKLNGTQYNSHDYAESALRTYLNDTLYAEIFSLREKQSILETTVLNRPGESAYVATQGMMTSSRDRLFVLSYWEATKDEYNLIVEDNFVMATLVSDYNVASGMESNRVENSYYSDWWLRTSGSHTNLGNRVTFSGIIGRDTECSVNLDYACGVRPAMWLKI
ncbi:MAG: hypothetical protein IJY07_04100 [Clostridia bacterium]|nr:hypothetical protein [Clostridia bacterium]